MTSLKVIIVGAGIAGLATAISLSQKTSYEITILESSPILTEAGAGIQCSSAAARVLCKWGLKEQFEAVATRPDYMEIRRYENNELLGLILTNVNSYSERLRGAPHWLVHRVDYQKILAKAAIENGVKIQFAQKVVRVDTENVTALLEDEKMIKADLIIGADGIHSKVRRWMPTLEDIVPRKSENFCYRALVPREKMLQNPVTAALIDNKSQQAWAGEFKHIISYPIAQGKYYNLVLILPDHGNAPLALYNEPGDVTEMREAYSDFNDTVQAVFDAISECAKWVLADLPPLPTWSSENGRVILLGDACHAMLPHAASGAATALEDAEVLGLCLATCKTLDDFPRAARDYEHLRKARCERIQGISRENAMTFSLPDGPQQQARDKILMAQKLVFEKQLAEDAPLVAPEEDMTKQYPNPAVVQWLVGHDVTAGANKYLSSRLHNA